MQRLNSTNWSTGDNVSAARLQDFNEDLDRLFAELSNENLSFSYDISGQCTQIVDNENSITINISWVDFNLSLPSTPKLYIQRVGDPKIYTVSYSTTNGMITSIVYA